MLQSGNMNSEGIRTMVFRHPIPTRLQWRGKFLSNHR